tara:strand:- start:154 stop:261 length:108 start_codon:yes stop_codon:yes gene_type:complete
MCALELVLLIVVLVVEVVVDTQVDGALFPDLTLIT